MYDNESDFSAAIRRSGGRSGPGAAALPQRPPEMQDTLNRHFYHPLARQIALRLAHTRVSPNAVSVAGGLCVIAAAVFYALPGWQGATLVALLLHLFWHVLDGADGDLARLKGTAGPKGEVIDGLSDYISHVVLYLVIGSMFAEEYGPLAWVLTVASGASRIVQSNFYETCKRQYGWWMHDRAWLRKQGLGKDVRWSRAVAWLVSAYLWLGSLVDGRARMLDRAYGAVEDDAAKRAEFRALIGRHIGPSLPHLNLLAANHRTILLGFAMLLSSPAYFFLYEVVALNLVLLWLSIERACAVRKVLAQFGAPGPLAA